MPVNKQAYSRYKAIDECLRNKFKPFPTMEELIDFIFQKTDHEVSKETVQKDIAAMKSSPDLAFYAPVKFSRKENGYFYEDEAFTISKLPLEQTDVKSIDLALSILQQFKGVPLLSQFEHVIDKIYKVTEVKKQAGLDQFNDFIQAETVPYFKGSELISYFSEVIQERKPCSFEYHSFTKQPAEVVLHAYLLKEYQNRWYVIGYSEKNKQVRIYGLDRIERVKTLKRSYFFDPDFSAQNIFKHSYGITAFKKEAERIVLQFEESAANYIRTMPLHHSQEILADDGKRLTISLYVMPTYEFISAIMGYGPSVKVISPQSLLSEVKQLHLTAAKQYED